MHIIYDDLAKLKAKCPNDHRTVMEWAAWVEYMIGPPEMYDRFVIKDHDTKALGMYLTNGGWCTAFDSARRYDWRETAILITENRRLEAIRIVDGIAEDSKGVIVGAE